MEFVKDMVLTSCHDCGAEVGEYHLENCDTERCPKCGGQLLSCDCFVGYDEDDEDKSYWNEEEFEKYERFKWEGIMFYETHLYAEKHDLWCYWGPPWVECEIDHPNATHDLNRASVQMHHEFKPRLKNSK